MSFRSSIFSSETLRPAGWRWPLGAFGAIAIVAAVELSLHVAQPWLPDPVLWGSNEVSAKVEQAHRISASGRVPIDLLVLGPSHASVGVSPADMTSAPGLAVYNGALNGRTYPALEFVFEHVYDPMLQPRALVLAVSPLVLNVYNRWMERNSEQLFQAPYPSALSASGLVGRWRRFLVDHVYLYRYRRRQPGLRDGRIDDRRRLDEYGWAPAGTAKYQPTAGGLPPDHPYRSIMYAYDFSGPSVEAFIRILERAQASGRPVLVVNMPFRPALLEIAASGQADYRRYIRAMEALRDQFGFTWLDYARLAFDDSDFRDVDHLNEVGARKLSQQLARDVAPVLAASTAVRGTGTLPPAVPAAHVQETR